MLSKINFLFRTTKINVIKKNLMKNWKPLSVMPKAE